MGRSVLEFRYGRQRIHRLVAEHEQEQATKQWIRSSTTPCPGCQSSVEKGMGCNHVRELFSFLYIYSNLAFRKMTCTRCRHHFCYRCGEKLDATDPYAHFSITGKSCYNKLFDWGESDEEE